MIVKILRWVSKLVLLLIATTFGTFTLLSFSPIDPIRAYIGNDLLHVPPEQYPLIAARWGLDLPLWQRFLQWFSQIIQGDFGYSLLYNSPVIEVIQQRLVTSASLLLLAWIFSSLVGVTWGLIAGRYINRWPDRLLSTLAYLLVSLPTFWLGLLLLMVFAVELQWAPICCAWPLGSSSATASWFSRLQHLILPVITLGLLGVGHVALHTRSKVNQVMDSEFILYAKAQGDSGWSLTHFHILPHVITPALCLQFASFGELLGGMLLTEKVFTFPGLGQATIDAGLRGDIPLLMAIVIVCTILVFIGNSIADKILQHLNRGVDRQL